MGGGTYYPHRMHENGLSKILRRVGIKKQARAEAKTAVLKDNVLKSQGKEGIFVENEIKYAGKRRLGRHPSLIRPRSQQHTSHGTRSSPFSLSYNQSSHFSGCFNCEERDRVIRKCKELLNIKRAAKARLNFF